MSVKSAKVIMLTATTVEPTGVEITIEVSIPTAEFTTDMAAAHSVSALKLRQTRIAERAGKMTSADMRSEPTRRIASTTVSAITTENRRL